MAKAKVITSVDQLEFSITDIPSLPLPKQVLMVEPTHYSVEYVINPHMEKNVGQVDPVKARSQWDRLKEMFMKNGLSVQILEGQEGLPDMVFCANQSLPYEDEKGIRKVIMSIMHARERKEEVPFVEQWYRRNGYEIHYLDKQKVEDFEGCGDALWHTGHRLLWGGYGYRSSLEAYRQVSDLLRVPVVVLELADESFYHLDTCLCILDEKTALLYPRAFSEEGLALIHALFETVITASKYEAETLFACNAACPDGQNVIIQKGSIDVNNKLRDAGFAVHEIDTGEFLKSGGSVFCMKQFVW